MLKKISKYLRTRSGVMASHDEPTCDEFACDKPVCEPVEPIEPGEPGESQHLIVFII
jgi:hypothetical protein